MASLTIVAAHRPVQLIYPLAPGLLVQAVDILSHHRRQLARLLQLCQLAVGRIGLCVREQHLIPVETEKSLRKF